MARKSKEQIEAETAERTAKLNAEIEAGVQARLDTLMPSIVAKIEAARGGPVGPADTTWAAVLGTQIAELAHQNTGAPKPVSPEVIKQRRVQTEKMLDLIVRYREEGSAPLYRVRSKCYFAETLIEPQWQHPTTKEMMDQEIEWPGVPNDSLYPLNEPAKRVMEAYLASIDSVLREEDDPDKAATFVHDRSGLVVKARPFGVKGTSEAVLPDGLKIHGAGGRGRLAERRVLGTVAPPIRIGM